MTLQLHPTNALTYIWCQVPGGPRNNWPPPRPTCQVCRYELIDGWCSRCDIEQNGVLA